MTLPRAFALVPALALVAAACGSATEEAGRPADTDFVQATCDDDRVVEVDLVESSAVEDVPSALDRRDDERFPPPLVDPADIRSGGPPPDGIPAIDEPRFVLQCSVDWLGSTEPVLVLDLDGDARAYPIQIMTWHELVNDTVGGIPVTVSYCPLCNSALAYDRQIDDRVLDFGTSGSLYRSSLVMYDRQTESLWSHFDATAVVGVETGTTLDVFPLQMVAFEEFRNAHPDGLVLSRDTGHSRDYGRNPYPTYDTPDASPFAFDGEIDATLAPMTRIVAIERDGAAVAVVLDGLLEVGVAHVELGGTDLVLFAKAGTASALDAGTITEGRDVGATGVFVAEADGQRLTFEVDGESFRDLETGSTWDIFGRAVDGPLASERLTALEHLDTFWFVWSTFQPDTEVVEPT